MSEPKPILFGLKHAPGDSIVLTGAIRDLVLQHSDKFRVSVSTNSHSVWYNNPHIKPPIESCQFFDLKYDQEMTRGNSGPHHTHFLTGFHNILSKLLGVPIVPTLARPDLHVLPEESHPPVGKPYWVIFPGHKRDIPLKAWPSIYWQQLVEQLYGWGIKCVQVGREDMENPSISGVESLVGKTSLRELFALIRDAEGVICGITQGIHIAAALEKPCVVLGGGRESWWWEAYVNENEGFGPASGTIRVPHRYLHTFGMFPCCERVGCHKQALFPSRRHMADKVCTNQVGLNERNEAACMAAIAPDKVRDAVLSYYLDGTLPPHNPNLQELVAKMPALNAINKPMSILRADGAVLQINSVPPGTNNQTEIEITPKLLLPTRPAVAPDPGFDHPRVGGRVTICVLTYGDFPIMHRRCLDAILTTVPAERVELRVAGNALCDKTTHYLQQLHESGDIQHLDLSPENRSKYPVMRRLFHDTPLNTNWVLWFDDDTFCDADPAWLSKLVNQIANTENPAVACHGPLYFYPLSPAWKVWCREAAWFENRPWIQHGTRSLAPFASGSFWAMSREAIQKCDIPDLRLGHNKGDVTIGCQIHQAGYQISRFSQNKEIVRWSDADRRGKVERHPAE